METGSEEKFTPVVNGRLQPVTLIFETPLKDLRTSRRQSVQQPMKDKRAEWSAAYKKKEQAFAAVNPPLSPEQVKQMFADISNGFAPNGSST